MTVKNLMTTKVISLRLPVEMIGALEKKGNSVNQAVIESITKLNTLERYSMKDLRGAFTESQWMALLDAFNGTNITTDFRYQPEFVSAQIADSDIYDGIGAKFNVDISALCEKIDKLTAAQIDSLYTRMETFWDNADTIKIEEWAKF